MVLDTKADRKFNIELHATFIYFEDTREKQ
jgi:hypothetical protein